jgi:hypothetical protein
MRASLSERAYRKWQAYWSVEPWGPWRDNLHAAIIAREVRRPYTRRGVTLALEPFMLQAPEARAQAATDKFAAWLGVMASRSGGAS